MKILKLVKWGFVILAGGMPLVTFASCDWDDGEGNFVYRSFDFDHDDFFDDLEDLFD